MTSEPTNSSNYNMDSDELVSWDTPLEHMVPMLGAHKSQQVHQLLLSTLGLKQVMRKWPSWTYQIIDMKKFQAARLKYGI
jgi:hypothetical protein